MTERFENPFVEFLERRSVRGLTDRLQSAPNAWLETDEIMEGLVRNAREPMPAAFQDYLRRRLNGEVRKRQGRGRRVNRFQTQLRDQIIIAYFGMFEDALNRRAKRSGLKGWPRIAKADWWQGPPSERAARMVRQKWRLPLSWKTILNIAKYRP